MTYLNRANKVLSPVLGHYTSIEIEKGSGNYLYSTDNKKYLDFSSGIAVASTGHCHPKVVKAIQNQAATLIHACAGVVYYDQNISLAEKLSEIVGNGLNSVFFTQSGSEAVEASLKLAKYVTKKHKILAFQGAFHGRTLGSLSVTTSKMKYRQGYEPLLEGISFFPYPYEYRCPWNSSNPEECSEKSVEALEVYFSTLDDNYAAVIIEPILGEGGYVPAPIPFLKKLRELCDQRNILLIFDEIQSGMGRTGSWFNFQKINVVPDILTVAKGIASGLPLGACIASKELMSKWMTGAHGGTYGGNPVTCAAGLATIDVITEILPKINELNTIALTTLRTSLSDHPFVGDIRGEGLMIGIEMVKDKNTKEPNPELVSTVMKECLEKELIVVSCGLYDNVIRLMPPLIIDEVTLKIGLEKLNHVITNHR